MAGYALKAFRSFGGTAQCIRKTVIDAGTTSGAGQEKGYGIGQPGVNRFCP